MQLQLCLQDPQPLQSPGAGEQRDAVAAAAGDAHKDAGQLDPRSTARPAPSSSLSLNPPTLHTTTPSALSSPAVRVGGRRRHCASLHPQHLPGMLSEGGRAAPAAAPDPPLQSRTVLPPPTPAATEEVPPPQQWGLRVDPHPSSSSSHTPPTHIWRLLGS